MEFYLLDRTTYSKLYNCSVLPDTEWAKYRRPNVFIGVFFLLMGILYQLGYIPFLAAMLKKEFIQHSCYRLMFYLGVLDFFATIVGGTIGGILLIRGDIFCTNPDLVYMSSSLACPLWSGSCMAGFILILNRIIDLINVNISEKIFSKNMTYVWLAFPTVYMIYVCFFTQPYLFNSIFENMFLDPYAGVPNITHDPTLYDGTQLVINNVFFVATFPVLYAILCVALFIKIKMVENANLSKLQKQTIFQSLLICLLIMITSVIYVYMNYFPTMTPPILIVIAHFTWQGSHGAAVFVYLFINKSLRKAVIEMFGRKVARLSTVMGSRNRISTNRESYMMSTPAA